MKFNFLIFGYFLFSLFLVSSLILMYLENVFCIISGVLILLKLVLWPSIESVLEKVPFVIEKDTHSAVFGWTSLYMSVRFSWFNSVVQVFHIFPDFLLMVSVTKRGILKCCQVV